MSLDPHSLDPSPTPSLTALLEDATERRYPLGVSLGAGIGVAWNLFGVVQFLKSAASTPDSLRAMGMTPEQAAALSSYPAWMTVAFAVGVFGGLGGSILMFARRGWAVPVFAASLAGYVVLYVGDVTEGVFAALGAPQVAILTTVVAIAVALLVASRRLVRRGLLR